MNITPLTSEQIHVRLTESEQSHIPPALVIDRVCERFNTARPLLQRRDNRPSAVMPRQVAMYLLRRRLGLAYPFIGKYFRKHHTTVMYAVQQVEQMRSASPEMDALLKELEA